MVMDSHPEQHGLRMDELARQNLAEVHRTGGKLVLSEPEPKRKFPDILKGSVYLLVGALALLAVLRYYFVQVSSPDNVARYTAPLAAIAGVILLVAGVIYLRRKRLV